MRILSVEIENILSIERIELSFPESGLLLIDGWNKDTGSANGAGKSAIFHALSWGVFGQYPRGVSITDFIRSGTKASSVSVSLDVPGIGLVKVSRSRPKAFKALLNESPISEEEFNNLLPIDYDQYIVAQYFAQSLGSRFLDLPDSGRKDVILKIMSADSFALYRESVDLDFKKINTEKSILINNINNLDGKISAFKESIVDVSDVENKITEIDKIRSKYVIELESMSDINEPQEIEKYSRLIDKLNQKINNISGIKGSIFTYRKMIKELDATPDPEDHYDATCPSCNSNLDIIGDKISIHDSSAFPIKLEKHRQAIDNKRNKLISSILSMELEIEKEDELTETVIKIKNKIKTIRTDYEQCLNRVRDIKFHINQLDSDKKSLLSAVEQQRRISSKIEEALSLKDKYASELDLLANKAKILEISSHILSPLGVPAYVMDTVISNINDKVRELLQFIWPSSTYELLSFRENKSGTIAPKMSDLLVIDGQRRSIGSLSGGEKRCLSLAVDFAITEVVSSYTGAQLNPLILDEPFDHLDVANRAKVIDFLQEMAARRCIVVIDHASEAKALFDNTITVVKQNGISTVQKDGIFH